MKFDKGNILFRNKEARKIKDPAIRDILAIEETNAEYKHFIEFLKLLSDENLQRKFIDFLESFENYEFYKQIVASTRLFWHANNKQNSEDKFLYLILASEVAYPKRSKRSGERFKNFYKENLSRNSKIKIVSSFKNDKCHEYFKLDDLLRYNFFNADIKSTQGPIYTPSCYRDKCDLGKCFYVESDYCEDDLFKCPLTDKELDQMLLDVLTFLYKKRNRFLHEGIGFSLPEDLCLPYLDIYEKHDKRGNVSRRSNVQINLRLTDLFDSYKEAIVNSIKNY